jgi:hypothetical protein
MAKKRIPSEQLRRKVPLLCEDANTLADDIKHLAHTAQNEHQAWLLAARASKIAIIAKSPDLWGWLFQPDHSSNVVLPKAS